jgi:O-antigen ligase
LQTVTFFGLLLIVVVAAIPYGEVNSPLQLIYASFIYLLCAGRAIDSFLDGSFALADKVLILPIIGLFVLALFQVLPLPINSATADAKGHLSQDPHSTVTFLLIFGSLVVMGETLLHLTNTRKRLVAVAATVLIIGIGSAVFGVIRHAIMGGGDILPIQVIDVAPAQYAQFINRNHFALLVEMTLGILLGLLLKARLSAPWKALLAITIAFCWFAIISANSRGGITSSGGVIILAAFVHFLTRTSRLEPGERQSTSSLGRLKMVLAVAGLIVVLSGTLIVSVALIGGDTTVSRFERTDRDFATVEGRASRLEIWRSTMRLIAAYPFIGSGFGAYALSITPFDTTSGRGQVIQQAHNEYLEIVAAGGVVAALLTLLFLGLIVRRVVQRFSDRGRLEKAIGFGAALGMFGVFLHSFVDFGLHVQINSLVFVLLIVLATAGLKDRRRRRRSADALEIAN